MHNNRIDYVDVAKGILILLVILGHIGFVFHCYIFWFHMPAFFIISGMFLPDAAMRNMLTWNEFKTRAIRFFVPYLSYFVLISTVTYFFIDDKVNVVDLVKRFLVGGRVLVGVYGTFWFITCLFISQYLFFIIQSFRLGKIYVVLILILLYFVGINVASLLKLKYIPYNADVTLIAVSYLFIGSYFKSILYVLENKRWRLTVSILITLLIIAFITIDNNVTNFYELNMKYVKFNNIVLDVLIPVIFFIGVLLLSRKLSFSKLMEKAFSLLGRNSLHIMYLHLLTVALLKAAGIQWMWIHLLLGSVVPIVIGILFNRNSATRFLFNGTYKVV